MKKSVFAGMLIGLAGWLNLSVGGGILGSILFSIGLYLVCLQDLDLFTGKAGTIKLGFVDWKRNLGWLFKNVLLGNIIGTALIAGLVRCTDLDVPRIILETRFESSWYSVLAKSVGCGMLMEFAVWGWKTYKSPVLIFLCVPAFILSGMYHSIADAFYYILSWNFTVELVWVYPLTVLGNFIGCNVRRIIT